MKRNLRTMAVVFWVLFIVATLLIFLPARAAEEAERTEDRTETAPECTDRAIEAEPEEDFENEYIEAALYAYGNFRVGCDICKGSRIGQSRKKSDAMSTPYGHGGKRIICRPTGTRRRTEHHFRKVTKMVCPLGERERKGGRGDGEGEGACGDDG